MTETTIPLLPCADPEATIEFYQALGFDVTDRQTRPYLYMAFRLGGFDLHFKDGGSNLVPAEELSGGSLVMVDSVVDYHRTFTAGLRRRYGRVLATGRPRMTRLRPGQTRFGLVDPSGNSILFIDRAEPDIEYGGSQSMSGLAKNLDNVRILRDFKNDDVLAARALDVALERHRDTAPRSDELNRMVLTSAERAAIDVELRAIGDLERWLSDSGGD